MFLGVDVGGTKTSFCVIEVKNKKIKVVKNEIIKTRDFSFKEWLELVKEKNDEYEAKGIGISCPGFLENGRIVNSPNFYQIEGKRLGDYIRKINKNYVIENDGNCFVLAEYHFLRKKPKRVFGWVFGTGIGGGAIIEGELISKRIEPGYQFIPIDQEFRDHLIKMSKNAGKIFKRFNYLTLEGIAGGKTWEELNGWEGIEDKIIDSIAIGFYNVQIIFDPSLYIIGGGAGKRLGKGFFERVKEKVEELYKIAKPDFKIKMGKIKNANEIGAVLLLLEKLSFSYL